MRSLSQATVTTFPGEDQAQRTAFLSLPLLMMPVASGPKHFLLCAPDPSLQLAYLVDFKELGISTWPFNGHLNNVRRRRHCSQRALLQDTDTAACRENQTEGKVKVCLPLHSRCPLGRAEDNI